MDENTVVELFAGVGGFRIGLNDVKLKNNKVSEKNNWKVVFANQWEPSTVTQHAYDCYCARFGNDKAHSNVDISKVNTNDIPDHKLLVGGFPCQDYSVARSLKNEKGIEGKKGVLWWEIARIAEAKRPKFILLENVDRLLKAPSSQRGRDFAIMLRTLNDYGYNVEWRVINAADYGHPQRRRRVFIFAYHNKSNYYVETSTIDNIDIIQETGIFQRAFPATIVEKTFKTSDITKYKDIYEISDNYTMDFQNSGCMINGKISTCKTLPHPLKKSKVVTLDSIREKEVDEKYFLSKIQIEKFEFLRGSKKTERTRPDGTKYFYSEGSMSDKDDLNLPGRTMLTSEGTTNRSTHIILDPEKNRLRFITPIEAERLNEFPDDWTNFDFMSDRKRYFTMGNALVTGIIKKLGAIIKELD